MKKHIVTLSLALGIIGMIVSVNQVHAQNFETFYDARCPSNGFPFQSDNFDQEMTLSKSRYNSYSITSQISFPVGRAGNTVKGIWLAYRYGTSHALERRGFIRPNGQVDDWVKNIQVSGQNTSTSRVILTVDPSKMPLGITYFYVEPTLRDGELLRQVFKINITP